MRRLHEETDFLWNYHTNLTAPATVDQIFSHYDRVRRLATSDQDKIMLESSPCSIIRQSCNKCYSLLTYALTDCSTLLYCKESIHGAKETCKQCMDAMYESCVSQGAGK